jgi:hypothetical protein
MLKRKILQIVGCVGLTVMAMAPAMALDAERIEGMTKILDMSTPDNAKFSNILKDYDYDNNVPPTLETLKGKVGLKDELQVFIPESSPQYFYYFDIDHKIANEFRKRFFGDVGNNRDFGKLKSNPAESKLEASVIKDMDFYSNGVMLTIDIKNSPLSVIMNDSRHSTYNVEYTFAYGQVLKAEIITKIKNKSDDRFDKEGMNYVLNTYKTALKNNGYNNSTLFGWGKENIFKKDNVVIEIGSNEKDVSAVYLGYLIPAVAKMTVYDKAIYDNYSKIQDEIKNKSFEKNYTRLNRILNN